MAFKMKGFTPFTKINDDDDKKLNIVISNKDKVNPIRDTNVCLPTDLNCPSDRKRIGKEILSQLKSHDKSNKTVKKVNPKKIIDPKQIK